MNLGQKKDIWTEEWNRLTPESEIRMWDFYGGRPWILKYAPRFGKTIEAGCGLGRYVFYLSHFGLDIEGLDFSKKTVEKLKHWSQLNHFKTSFVEGDVLNLPYSEDSISGYISLGVVEHFIEGPSQALKEAFRVLRPGGIAIVTVPSISFNVFLHKAKKRIKSKIKKIMKYPPAPEIFFQYWYRPRQLKQFLEIAGFRTIKSCSADLLYAFNEMGNFSGKNIQQGTFAYWFSNRFENTLVNNIGAQSITISIKTAKTMHCFLCGEMKAFEESLKKYDVPICESCSAIAIAVFYEKNKKTKYHLPYQINPPAKLPTSEKCEFCNQQYMTNWLFENFGFSKKVCPRCLKELEINIILSNSCVMPVWRRRQNG